MKKLALTLLILAGTLTAQADGYTYLTLETTDGTKTSVDVSSLPVTINLDNTTLTIGSQTFALADLSKMYFSTQSETTGFDKIDDLQIDDLQLESTEIYDLSGKKIVNRITPCLALCDAVRPSGTMCFVSRFWNFTWWF